jgi:hypothetical protein
LGWEVGDRCRAIDVDLLQGLGERSDQGGAGDTEEDHGLVLELLHLILDRIIGPRKITDRRTHCLAEAAALI